MSGTEVWIEATGSNQTDDYWSAWADFLAGHWQRERPTKPGNYPTADRDGHFNGYDRIALVEHDNVLETIMPGGEPGVDSWLGWWWSEPIPKLPKPRAWVCEHKNALPIDIEPFSHTIMKCKDCSETFADAR